MFRYLRVKKLPVKTIPEPGMLSADWLSRDSQSPITITQLNNLPERIKQRVYRALLPPELLTRFNIDPFSWKGTNGDQLVFLKAAPGSGVVNLSLRTSLDAADEFYCIELADNAYNGVDLNLLLLNNPESPRFGTDFDGHGNPTMFGTLRRNLSEEERAMQAGLAPGQVRSSLGASRQVIQQVDAFLDVLGHRAYFLEPLTYASAWVFERRGFAYVRGHKLMDDIHQEIQPGGLLYKSLDGSTSFRNPDQWKTIRGRAWAIHDGVLDSMQVKWDKLRMVKQIGKHAGVETSPGTSY